ncbi:MAG: hypothetical protein ACFB0B_19525 [Thermonemataceae bacterium]
MKAFPRIHSLSTLGLIHHQEFDYQFHPLRTDFIGDSGTGKSMIGDLLQLIFVGSAAFESATVGTDDRTLSGMVLEQGQGTNFAYAFMNITTELDEYITIGAYIETTGRNTHSFIIQNGYDSDKLIPLNQPLYCQDFIKDDEILPIDQLEEYLEEKGHTCHSWQRSKPYLEILFKNQLLALDLTSNDKALKDFAQIVQSFSRGKTLDTKQSSSLKNFLFDDTEAKKIMKSFREVVKEFESEIGDYGRNLDEIQRVKEKQEAYLELYNRKSNLEKQLHEWLIKSCAYYDQQVKELHQKLTDTSNQFIETTHFLREVNSWAVNQLLAINYKSEQLNLNKEKTRIALSKAEEDSATLNNAKKIIDELKCEPYEIRDLHKRNKETLLRVEAINLVESTLRNENLIAFFEGEEWPDLYSTFNTHVNNTVEKIEDELGKKETLKHYSDINDENSLANWALNLGRPLSYEEESVLVHFNDLTQSKPNDRSKYLPNPEELILALKIVEKEEEGFWLNLNGIREFIYYTKNRVFKESNKSVIISYFEAYSGQLVDDIKQLTLRSHKLKSLTSVFSAFENPKQSYEFYYHRAKIEKSFSHELLNFNNETLEKYLSCLSREKEIKETYVNAKEDDKLALEALVSFKNQTNELEKIKEISDWTSPFSEQVQTLLEKFESSSSNTFTYPFQNKKLQDLIEEITKRKGAIKHLDPVLLNKEYEESIRNKDSTIEKYKSQFKTTPDIIPHKNVKLDEPRTEKEKYIIVEKGYQEQFRLIINQYLQTDSYKFETEPDFLELGKNLLPEALRNEQITERNIIEKINHYLRKINEKNRELSTRKMLRIRDILEDVANEVSNQDNVARRIDNFFKSGGKQITGGYRVRLTRKPSQQFPLEWISNFEQRINSETNLFDTGDRLKEDLSLQVSLEEMMKEAFVQCGGLRSTDASIQDLLNPSSYFDLSFSMESDAGRTNIGSTGQTYAAIAMLCIARLSIIDTEEGKKQKPGIRFMPIDEAEGLGSNYDLLYNIAKTYDYQIISMSVGSVGKFEEGDQYIYILHENTDQDEPINFKPFAIFNHVDLENLKNEYQSYI